VNPIERIVHRSQWYAPGFLVVALASGCGTDPTEPDPPVPAAIRILPDSSVLFWVDETAQLTATVYDAHGTGIQGATVTWTSDDGSVVTVDSTGLVTAVGKGVASVRAAAGEVEGFSTITVNPDRRALLEIYEALGGPGWRRDENWGTDAPLGQWHGVTADSEGNVQALNLQANRLSGTIPAAIGLLGALGTLQLRWNDIAGPIPPELGNPAGTGDTGGVLQRTCRPDPAGTRQPECVQIPVPVLGRQQAGRPDPAGTRHVSSRVVH